MEEQAPDEDELWSMLAQAIREACTQFTVARTSEGEHLKADLVENVTSHGIQCREGGAACTADFDRISRKIAGKSAGTAG